MDITFSKDDVKIGKGVAIILMIMYHIWKFPERIVGGGYKPLFEIFDLPAYEYIGTFGNMCVALFFFVGGYGIYMSNQAGKFNLIDRIKKLYLTYWKVFIIFIPIAFLFFTNQPDYSEYASICHRFTEFEWEECLLNFFGFSSSYNGEWWFLIQYIYAMITFPVIKKMLEKGNALTHICGVVIAGIVITNVTPALGASEMLGRPGDNFLYRTLLCPPAPYIISFWMGIVMARDGLMDKLRSSLQNSRRLTPFADIIGILTILFLRVTAIGWVLDFVFVPFFLIFIIDLIGRLKPLKAMFGSFGRHSTNMWLIHTFLCYYFYPTAKLVTASGYAIPSLITIIAMSYVSSLAVNYFWKAVMWVIHRLIGLFSRREKRSLQ